MPSVYLTKMNSGPAIPSFAQRGIADQMPGSVGEVPIIVTADHPRFSTYLYRFFFYTILSKVHLLSVLVKPFNLFKPITTLPRLFEVPVCTFRFGNLNPSEQAELKAMGLQQDQTNANLFVGTPASHYLARIHELGPIDDRLRPGHLNFDAFFSWVYLMKGIQVLLTTQNLLQRQNMLITIDQTQMTGPGKKLNLTTLDGMKMEVDSPQPTHSFAPFSGEFIIGAPTVDLSSFPGAYHDASTSKTFGEGIFFPFFPGMSTMDKETAAKVFLRFFDSCLSADEESGNMIMNKIRSGARHMGFSRTGMAIAHIYRVLEIASQIEGSRPTIITKGATYAGLAIEASFTITMYGKVTKSGDINQEIKNVDALERQAQEVCDLLNDTSDLMSGQSYTFVKSDFLKSRIALHSFNKIDPDTYHSSNTLDKVRGILMSMEFNDVYPLPNQDSLLDCVRFMSTGMYSSLSEYPAYLGGGVLQSRSRSFEALSMFGPKVPSCNYGDSKGTLITFPRAGKEDTNLVKVGGVRPLQYFPFQAVPINVAASQWDKMINSGTLAIPKGRKNRKEFTDLHRVLFSIGGDPQFTELYSLIKGMVGDARNSGQSAGKRKRGMEEEGSGAKKARGMKFNADL